MIINDKKEMESFINEVVSENYNKIKSVARRLTNKYGGESDELVNESIIYLISYGKFPREINNGYLYFLKSMTHAILHPSLGFRKIEVENVVLKEKVVLHESMFEVEDAVEFDYDDTTEETILVNKTLVGMLNDKSVSISDLELYMNYRKDNIPYGEYASRIGVKKTFFFNKIKRIDSIFINKIKELRNE